MADAIITHTVLQALSLSQRGGEASKVLHVLHQKRARFISSFLRSPPYGGNRGRAKVGMGFPLHFHAVTFQVPRMAPPQSLAFGPAEVALQSFILADKL